MPELKIRKLFISHAWSYDEHYNKVVEWFNNAPNFAWYNYSVPSTDALPDKTKKGLREGLTRQLNPTQGVIILAGMYVAHSEWIEYEISEAQRLKKTIIGVKPWGQERIPTIVQEAAVCMVGWNSASIIQAVREYI